MVKARTKCVENAIIRTRKETAEKFVKELLHLELGEDLFAVNVADIVYDKVEELAKEFGVEVESGE